MNPLSVLFTAILNMSITASYAALAVIALRLLFSRLRLPKIFAYALWLAVLVRLLVPVSFSSSFSLFGLVQPETVQSMTGASIQQQESSADTSTPPLAPAPEQPAAPLPGVPTMPPASATAESDGNAQLALQIGSWIWAAGATALLLYSIFSYMKVRKTVSTAIRVNNDIYESDRISTPFVFGMLRPKIYLPASLQASELSYIIAHERTHIRRLDHMTKPLAFAALIVHWFNPIMWLSFALMSKDMEMSCDEAVIRRMGSGMKGDYSRSLLSLSMNRSGLPLGPPAFGESSIKARIKHILSYKKPAVWVAIAASILTAVFIIMLASNPSAERINPGSTASNDSYNAAELIASKTPYVGDNSKVAALIGAMPIPDGLSFDSIRLITDEQPYGIVVNYRLAAESAAPDAHLSAMLRNNAILLFSLIDNADVVSFDMIVSRMSFTREMADEQIGEDVRSFSTSAEELQKLIERLERDYGAPVDMSIKSEIDLALGAIVSSPSTSSNPGDYIKVNRDAYESILKYGDEALIYLMSKFEQGLVANNLEGHIIMSLCKDLLGNRSQTNDDSLLPLAWYEKQQIFEEKELPDFKAAVNDPVEQLVYDAAIHQYSRAGDGFTVVSPSISGSYEEESMLKVFATIYIQRYKLYDRTLSEEGGAIIPAAITFAKDENGDYQLQQYEEAQDGSYYAKSIENFSTMPVSGIKIDGLYDKIMNDHNNAKREETMNSNLIQHLILNGHTGVSLKQSDGTIIPLT